MDRRDASLIRVFDRKLIGSITGRQQTAYRRIKGAFNELPAKQRPIARRAMQVALAVFDAAKGDPVKIQLSRSPTLRALLILGLAEVRK